MSCFLKDLEEGTIIANKNTGWYAVVFESAKCYLSYEHTSQQFKSIPFDDKTTYGGLIVLPFTVFDVFKILQKIPMDQEPRVNTSMKNANIGGIQVDLTPSFDFLTVRLRVSSDKFINYNQLGKSYTIDILNPSPNYPNRIIINNLPQVLKIIADIYKEPK